jgi:hypothetical protein
MGEAGKVLLLDDVCNALTRVPLIAVAFQAFFSLGGFLYALWLNYWRGHGDLKGDFVEISNLLNRLCTLCAYVVIFLTGVYFANALAWKLSSNYELLSQIYIQFGQRHPWLSVLWNFLTLGVMVVLPTLLFPFLGGLARNVKAEELERIGRLLSRVSSREEKGYLASRMSQVMDSLKLVSVADYLARAASSAYIGLLVAKALAWL